MNECLDALSSDGADACGDKSRNDYVLSVAGLAATDEYCEDVLLPYGYRICYGGEVEMSLIGDDEDLETAFPRLDSRPAQKFSDGFYFMNASGVVHSLSSSFSLDDVISDIVSAPLSSPDAGQVAVYVVAPFEGDEYVFRLSTDSSSATDLFEAELRSSDLYGLAASNTNVYAAYFSGQMLIINNYDIGSARLNVEAIECGDDAASLNEEANPNGNNRFLSVGDDGFLYTMCNDVVGQDRYFAFLQIDPSMSPFQATEYLVDLNNATVVTDDDGDSTRINRVEQLIQANGLLYISTGSPYFNLIEVDLSPVPTFSPTLAPTAPVRTAVPTMAAPPPPPMGGRRTLMDSRESTGDGQAPATKHSKQHKSSRKRRQVLISSKRQVSVRAVRSLPIDGALAKKEERVVPVNDVAAADTAASAGSHRHLQQEFEVLGVHDGVYMSRGFNGLLYFNDGNMTYFNTSSSTFDRYDDDNPIRSDHYYTTAMQLAYSYGICDEKADSYLVDPDLSSDFADYCSEKNG